MLRITHEKLQNSLYSVAGVPKDRLVAEETTVYRRYAALVSSNCTPVVVTEVLNVLTKIVRRKVPGSEADRAPVGGDRVSDSQESGLSTSSVGGTPDTVTRIVRRTVAGRGGEETVVEEESQGESDVARRIRDSARGLFSAAAKLAGSRGGSDSDMSESDTVLFSLTQSKTSDTHNQVGSAGHVFSAVCACYVYCTTIPVRPH